MSERPQVEFFFSFRSPYSYLAAPRAFALPERYEIEFLYRGVRPMVTRGVPLPNAKRLYILRDAAREAKRLGMPFGKMYDAIGKGALRSLSVAEYAASVGKQKEFVLRASRGVWADGIDTASDAGLKRICQDVGLDWNACRAAMTDGAIAKRIETNIARLRELGQWGVPTFCFQGEVFWGQDRIEDLEATLKDAGVEER